MKDFKDKVAVVTGAAHGIGKSLVYAFANRGMKVVLADINQKALQELERDLREKHNTVAIKVTDVGDPNQVSELADFAYEKYGNVNMLCNNAGVCHSAAIRLLSLEDWNWVLQVNLLSVIYGVHYFLNRMLESNTPCHIVNTSSDYGLDSGKLAPYSVTKHGVTALSEVLNEELRDTKVGISVLCPCNVRTNLLENTENLGQQQSGVLELSPEVFASLNLDRSTLENALNTGLDPDIVADYVIKAIENQIFYILYEQELVQRAQTRFERIKDDFEKLKGIRE